MSDNLYKYVTLSGEIKEIHKHRDAIPMDEYWGAYVSSYANPDDIDGDILVMQGQVLAELAEYEEEDER